MGAQGCRDARPTRRSNLRSRVGGGCCADTGAGDHRSVGGIAAGQGHISVELGTAWISAGAAQQSTDQTGTKQTPTTEKSASSKVRHVTGKISDDGKTVTADKDNKSYTIDNPDAVKGHEGHEVRLSGHIDASNNSIHVTKVKMAGEKTSKNKAGTMSEQSPK